MGLTRVESDHRRNSVPRPVQASRPTLPDAPRPLPVPPTHSGWPLRATPSSWPPLPVPRPTGSPPSSPPASPTSGGRSRTPKAAARRRPGEVARPPPAGGTCPCKGSRAWPVAASPPYPPPTWGSATAIRPCEQTRAPHAQKGR
eukprot:scaffold5365_cov115-Isochrysis_galbana.AAC.12